MHDNRTTQKESPGMTLVRKNSLTLFEHQFLEFRRQRRIQTWIGGAMFAFVALGAAYVGQVDPVALIEGGPKLAEYVDRTLPQLRWESLGADLAIWFYGLEKWLSLLLETVLMAYLATMMGSVGALFLCFYASRNLAPNRWSYVLARRIGEFCRTIPDLVFALIFVFAFGLGPLPGILAMAIHSLGAHVKLFSEANENIDLRPVDGLRSLGAGWVQTMRFAVLPQVLPNYASYILWRFEINVRTAAVLGFVGAGGIGSELIIAVRSLYYEDISAIVIMIVAVVTLIDIGCGRMRHRLIGRESLI